MPAVDTEFKPLTFDDCYDPELDAEYRGKVRKVVLENGNWLWMESEDPYGYWTVKLKRGKLPDNLQNGSFTTFRDLLNAVNIWLKDRKHPIVYTTTKDKALFKE